MLLACSGQMRLAALCHSLLCLHCAVETPLKDFQRLSDGAITNSSILLLGNVKVSKRRREMGGKENGLASFPVCEIKYSDRSSLMEKVFCLVGFVSFCSFVVVVLFCFCLLGAHHGGEIKAAQPELTSARHLVSTTGKLRKRNACNQLTFYFLFTPSWNW